MKGIAHFASGLVAASFVPGVAEASANGSLLIALGGACAMLPDWLDFKFARFLEKRDAEIAPDPINPNPQVMADTIAEQLRLAQTSPRVVQLHPTRRGAIDWLLYSVRFDVAHGDVVVTMNGEVARAHACPLDYTYDGALDVIELGGPSLKFSARPPTPNPSPVGTGEGKPVRIEFLPWHRTWSHSLILALLAGIVCGLLMGLTAGIVAALGYAVHVLEDQLGFMGSNLLWPFTHRRSNGLGLLHSGDTIPNMVTVWLSLTLLLLNLDRARDIPLLPFGPYAGFVVLLPTVLLVGIYARGKWQKHITHLQSERQRDVYAESQEVQV
jgi:LexA-binding, inner membrane-associated putative hydrolase